MLPSLAAKVGGVAGGGKEFWGGGGGGGPASHSRPLCFTAGEGVLERMALADIASTCCRQAEHSLCLSHAVRDELPDVKQIELEVTL